MVCWVVVYCRETRVKQRQSTWCWLASGNGSGLSGYPYMVVCDVAVKFGVVYEQTLRTETRIRV